MDVIVEYYEKNYELYQIFANANHLHGQIWNIDYDGHDDIIYVMFAELKYIEG